jgi:hypothetical protein
LREMFDSLLVFACIQISQCTNIVPRGRHGPTGRRSGRGVYGCRCGWCTAHEYAHHNQDACANQ